MKKYLKKRRFARDKVILLCYDCPHAQQYEGIPMCAEVAELVDARDSKSRDGDIMSVRFRPSVPIYLNNLLARLLYNAHK